MKSLFLIKKPLRTEKAIAGEGERKYSFLVKREATKPEIKKLVKRFYRVDPLRVNVVNLPGKPKRFRNIITERGAHKKVIVTLREGQKIDFG